ncbi:MAG: thiamine diphosphokinase [Parachlamydiaceae bacterium]
MNLLAQHWLIVANGYPVQKEELAAYTTGRKILALNGAANHFQHFNLYPHYILGDFDSIEDPQYWGIRDDEQNAFDGNFGVTIIPAKDQDLTDLEKGIRFCDQQRANSILLVQVTGGRMDHTLGNLRLLKKYSSLERPLVAHTDREQIFFLRDSTIFIEGGEGEYCAILGFPKATITTSGLLYDSSNYLVELGVQDSICNQISEPKSLIAIGGEALIILPKQSTWRISR